MMQDELLDEKTVMKLINDASAWCLHQTANAVFSIDRLEAYKRMKEYDLLRYRLKHQRRKEGK